MFYIWLYCNFINVITNSVSALRAHFFTLALSIFQHANKYANEAETRLFTVSGSFSVLVQFYFRMCDRL